MTDDFVYIETSPIRGEVSRFDVYRDNGNALGEVIQVRLKLWEARDPESGNRSRRCGSRAEAARGLWAVPHVD